MSNVDRIDQTLAYLKRRFARGDLTYAESVMVEDLIEALGEMTEDLETGISETPLLPPDRF